MNRYACMTLVFILSFATVAFAQVSTDNAYQVRYTVNLNQGDSFIRIVNTGARGGVPATPGPGGEICADVYGFAPNGQMNSCCSCLVPPDGFVSLSVWQDLLRDSSVFPTPNAMAIKLLATVPVAGVCQASAVNTATLAPGLASWGTTLQPSSFFISTPEVKESPFTPSTLSASELAKLAAQCTAIHGGAHSCKSCPAS